MDFKPSSRTIGAKYGKNKGRAQLHNFHDLPATSTTVLPASRQLPISPPSTATEQQDRGISKIPTDPPSPSPKPSPRPAHITSHSRSSFSTSHGSQPALPAIQNDMPSVDVDMSTYDLEESDDELEILDRRPIKRLRLSPVEKDDKRIASKEAPKPLQRVEKKDRIALAKRQENLSTKSSQEIPNSRSGATKGTSKATSETASEIVLLKAAAKSELKAKTAKATVSASSKPTAKNIKPSRAVESAPRPTLQKSRTKLKSRSSGATTPKKATQPVTDSDASGASPSQLGLDHLRLTTGGSPEPLATLEPPTFHPTVALPRGRNRLIDRLDAASSGKPVRADVAASNFAKELERLQKGVEKEKPVSISEVPKLSRTGSSQTRQTYGRAKNTYAKERSHLSDMVDELDPMSTNSSQDPNQQFLSGLLANGPSQIQSQLELESDSSEDAPSYKLKSIYELKQAGTNSRLEKEVEDLMTDVNPTGGSKASRIQALMQMVRKMSQDGFPSFLFERALERLTVWSPLMKDKISKLLLGMVFWRLVQCSTASPPGLKQIIYCVLANSSSLPPLINMAQIAKSRAENLTKDLVHDLVEFERMVVREGLLPTYEGDGVIPAAIMLGALNDSLKKTVDTGTIIPLPQSSFKQILALFQQVSQPSGDQVVKHVFITKLALSVLQVCAGLLEQDLGLSQNEYQTLGDTLGGVIHRSTNIDESLVQSVVHFAISLCDGSPEICQIICRSSLVDSLMTIIRSRFLDLVNSAGDSQEIEQTMLNSIILSLACLFNLTEHDHAVRRMFASSALKDSSTTHLSRLVDIYMDTAPRLKAFETEAETSALILVGYLSLVICNLCLDEQLWQAVSEQLSDGYGVSDIVVSAKMLLIHFRSLDNTSEGSGTEKGNAALEIVMMRYGEALSAVKLE